MSATQLPDQTQSPNQPDRGLNRGAWFVLRCVMVPVLCVVVAMLHFREYLLWDRSSWGPGAGFGMFATLDHHANRFFRCYVEVDGEALPAAFETRKKASTYELLGPIEKLSLRARITPTPARLEALAEVLANEAWVRVSSDTESGSRIIPKSEFESNPVDTWPNPAEPKTPPGSNDPVESKAAAESKSPAESITPVESKAIEHVSVDRVRLELWRTRLRSDANRLEVYKTAEVSVNVP